jgi:hypothetical protein
MVKETDVSTLHSAPVLKACTAVREDWCADEADSTDEVRLGPDN